MEIDGASRKEIREALIEAFPGWNQLKRLVDDRLNMNLQNISSQFNELETVAFDLVRWAIAHGRLTDLVIAAAAENPESPGLRLVAERFRFAEPAAGELEKIVLNSVQFQNVGQWLDQLSRLRRSVGRIEPQPNSTAGYGTGFLVGPDVLMTNLHVAEGLPTSTQVRFDYEIGIDGTRSPGTTSGLAGASSLVSSPEGELDFALLRLSRRAADDEIAPAARRGFLTPKDHHFARDEPLVILQYPEAEPMKLSIGSVLDTGAPSSSYVTYNANTMPGSSGSPCFTSALEPVALHHRGLEGRNQGVCLGAILAFLKDRGKAGLLG